MKAERKNEVKMKKCRHVSKDYRDGVIIHIAPWTIKVVGDCK